MGTLQNARQKPRHAGFLLGKLVAVRPRSPLLKKSAGSSVALLCRAARHWSFSCRPIGITGLAELTGLKPSKVSQESRLFLGGAFPRRFIYEQPVAGEDIL